MTTEPQVEGCGSCAVKSAGNCTAHFTKIMPQIVAAFIGARKEGFLRDQTGKVADFNPKDPTHVELVKETMLYDLKDPDDTTKQLSYVMPERSDPLHDWLLGNVDSRYKQQLKAEGMHPV